MIQDPFQRLIPEAQAFLLDLSQNNTRDWFQTHKPRYDTALKGPAMALLDVVSADLQRLTGAPVTPKLFRPQRDVRFSKDKTPYHLHVHMLWGVGGSSGTGYFFGIELDRIVLGAGCMGMQGDALTAYRQRVAGPDGADLAGILGTLTHQGIRLNAPELKRVPAPFDKAHPQGDLLRRKSLTLWQDMEKPPTDLRAVLNDGFTQLLPVMRWLQG